MIIDCLMLKMDRWAIWLNLFFDIQLSFGLIIFLKNPVFLTSGGGMFFIISKVMVWMSCLDSSLVFIAIFLSPRLFFI